MKLSVELAILMDAGLSLTVVIAGATMSLVFVKLRSGCVVPNYVWSLVTVIDAWMIRVACAGIECLLSVFIVMSFGLHFAVSSAWTIVIWIFGRDRFFLAQCLYCGLFASPIVGYEFLFIIMNVSSIRKRLF